MLSVYKAVSDKHTETGIAGQKREYGSKGSYSFSVYSDKTAIGTLVFPENLLYNESTKNTGGFYDEKHL